MSQRESGYGRKAGDLYETPEWVTEALLPHMPKRVECVWEPACGSGKMSRVLKGAGYLVYATDIDGGIDFLTHNTAVQQAEFDWHKWAAADAIITNPPYAHAQAFIEKALSLVSMVAMLLRCDFDHAKTRQHLFGEGFAKKLVLTKRIRWFEDTKGSPSFNHAWFIWDHNHEGPPTLAYGPTL